MKILRINVYLWVVEFLMILIFALYFQNYTQQAHIDLKMKKNPYF
jgi:hypothetical protein